MGSANTAEIVAVIGASGSGKSTWLKTAFLKPAARRRRLLVWDFKREYLSAGIVTAAHSSIADLVEGIKAGGGRFALAFLPDFDPKRRARQFDRFCRAAYALGDLVMVVEELSFVTTASYAPPAWSMVTCTGRHEGLTVVGTSQRPAQVDKNFFGNCTLIHSHRVQDANDVRVMSSALDVPASELRGLAQFSFVERDMQAAELRRGRVQFRVPAAAGKGNGSVR